MGIHDQTNLNKRLSTWLLLNVIVMLLGAITGIGYYSMGGIMAPISDFMAILISITFIVLCLGIYKKYLPELPKLSGWSRMIGLSGHILFGLSGLALVISYAFSDQFPESWNFGSISFSIQLVGIAIEGVWLFMVAVLSMKSFLNRTIIYSLFVAGTGNFLFAIGTDAGSYAIGGTGGFIGLIATLVWALSYRKSLKNEKYA